MAYMYKSKEELKKEHLKQLAEQMAKPTKPEKSEDPIESPIELTDESIGKGFLAFIILLIAAAVGFGVAKLMGLEGVARGVLIIETIVPVAIS